MMAYQYEFDDTPAGDLRLSTDSYQLLQECYRALRVELAGWNATALEHGASGEPYASEVEDLDRIIAWGDKELGAPAVDEVIVKGISVGSLRYAKASLAFAIQKRQEELAERQEQSWPDAVLDSLGRGIGDLRELESRIDKPPAEVLWQVIPRQMASAEKDHGAMEWDVFISHASEDKEGFVRPLAEALQDQGLRVWYDEFSLDVGDSLRRSIDQGLAHSTFGVVVVSPDFLSKEWPQRELDGLVAREVAGVKVILPVWHNITVEELRSQSPTLADRVATSSTKGIEHVVSDLMRAITKDRDTLRSAAESQTGPETPTANQEATDVSQPFPEASPTVSPAHYFDPAEVLVPADLEREWTESRCSTQSLLYLRVFPKSAVPALQERMMRDLIRTDQLGPLSRGSGFSDDRNRFGGIVYHSNRDTAEVLTATQLFRSREIWGFDMSVLQHTLPNRAGHEVPTIPSLMYEQILLHGLRRYLELAHTVLDYPLPVVVEAGASNVEGYFMSMNNSTYANPLWGPVHRQHIVKRVELGDWTVESSNRALLAIFEEFFDAVGAERPDRLNGFPPGS